MRPREPASADGSQPGYREAMRPHFRRVRTPGIRLPALGGPPNIFGAAVVRGARCPVGRDYDPTVGQWYENLEEDEVFQVLSVDPDQEIVELQYDDGDVEELDLDTWHEMDLELSQEPEGWSGSEDQEDDDEDWEEEEEEDEDDDDDWDDDDDDDDDWDDDFDDEGYRDRE
jgi:Family of unknown function (DUF6763)